MVCVKSPVVVCGALFLPLQVAFSFSPSTFLGLAFPAPQALSTDPTTLTAHSKFNCLVQCALDTGITTRSPFDNTTTPFSFEFFFATDSTPLYKYHYTPSFLSDTSLGVKTADGDTIY
jgi:hypothetical protein